MTTTTESLTDTAKAFAKATLRKRELEAQLRLIEDGDGEEEGLKALGVRLIERMQDQGTMSLKLRIGQDTVTVYAEGRWWAYAGEDGAEAVCKTLRRAGGDWKEFVKPTYNLQSLSAHVRQIIEAKTSERDRRMLSDDEIIKRALPPTVAGALDARRVWKPRMRSS